MLARTAERKENESDFMLLRQRDSQALLRTKALAEGVKEVAAELRLVDLADFVTFIHREQFANIQDIVNSSVELFFKHGTLTYGAMAAFDLDWDRPPTVTLGMEFHYQSVTILFDLMLQAQDAGVEIRAISFSDTLTSMEEETKNFVDAIAAARLSRPHASRPH
jgi:hypothetical protein